jgi:hypothetical protein
VKGVALIVAFNVSVDPVDEIARRTKAALMDARAGNHVEPNRHPIKP